MNLKKKSDAVVAKIFCLISPTLSVCGPDATLAGRCDGPGGAADGKVDLYNVSIASYTRVGITAGKRPRDEGKC